RAFEACGPRLSASLVYDWARRWQRRHDEKRINQRERYSIVRVLMTMAVRDGRAGTRGRPWLWRRIESHSRYFIYLKVAFKRGREKWRFTAMPGSARETRTWPARWPSCRQRAAAISWRSSFAGSMPAMCLW